MFITPLETTKQALSGSAVEITTSRERVCVVADADIHIAMAGTASANTMLVPADVPMYFNLPAKRISLFASSGNAYVTECA